MVDSYYGIGGGHLVCQDYALHGSLNEMEYVIVSDGCSSADYSEIGSQVLCHAARYHLTLCYQTGLFKECSMDTLCSFLGNSILKRIDEVRKIYPITRDALEASLLIAVKIKSEFYIFAWGDGVIIENFQKEDGFQYQHILDIDHQNKPFYLVNDRDRFYQKFGIDFFEHHYFIYESDTDTACTESVPFDKPYTKHFTTYKDLVSLTICSDGITSFKDIKKEPIPLSIMVPQFVSFKTVVEGYVKKRIFFMKRDAVKNGWTHYDDISSGTIII